MEQNFNSDINSFTATKKLPMKKITHEKHYFLELMKTKKWTTLFADVYFSGPIANLFIAMKSSLLLIMYTFMVQNSI